MSEQREFIRAWRKWQRLALPTENFRQERGKAPTYSVELKLDHMVSSVYGTVQGFFDGRPWDHLRRVGDYLEELHQMEAGLDVCAGPEAQVQRLRDFIHVTRTVLHTFSSWVRAREQAYQTLAADAGPGIFSIISYFAAPRR